MGTNNEKLLYIELDEVREISAKGENLYYKIIKGEKSSIDDLVYQKGNGMN